MDCFIGLAIGVLGLMLTISGKIKVSGSSESRGPLVRVAGILLMLAMPLYLGIFMAIGFNEGMQAAMNNPNGQVNQQQVQNQVQQKIMNDYWWMWIAIYSGAVALALILLFSSIKPVKKYVPRRHRRRDDDDGRYDDRRRDDDDYGRRYDDDDDDREDDRRGRFDRR